MVKKSVAAIIPQWAFRKVFQLVGRRPAGSIPFSARTRLIVFRPTVYPRFARAPGFGCSPIADCRWPFRESISESHRGSKVDPDRVSHSGHTSGRRARGTSAATY